MMVGVICSKFNIIDKNANKALSSIVVNISATAVIFNSYQIEIDSEILSKLCISVLLSMLSYSITMIVAKVMIVNKNEDFNIERFSIIYTNCGFIGIPLISGIYGKQGVLYLSAYITIYNLLIWTHGIRCMTGKCKNNILFTVLKTPAIIGIIVGVIFMITNLRLPEILQKSVDLVADTNTPLAMFVSGVSLTQTKILNALRNKRIYIVSFLRLILVPIIFIALVILIPFDIPKDVFTTILIATACPVGSYGIIFAINFDKNFSYATEIFSFTTLISMVTMPALLHFSKQIINLSFKIR